MFSAVCALRAVAAKPVATVARVRVAANAGFFMSARVRSTDESKPAGEAAKPAEGADASAAQIAKLQEEVVDLKDRYVRKLAEMENLRTRTAQEVVSAKEFAIQKFCKDLLEVADVMEMAVASIPEAQREAGDANFKNLYQGLTTTQSMMLKVFERNGLTGFSPEGKDFDPNLHDAQFQMPAGPGQEAGKVAAVIKRGYTLHGRTVRPAMVGVFRKP